MLGEGRLVSRRKRREDDVDPMSGVANLSDVMLVFACGLMVSLILNWNVDLGKNKVEMLNPEQMQEVEDPEKITDQADSGQGYQEKGIVYEDPETGKMYVIMPREE